MNIREMVDTKRVREFRLLFYEITGMFTSMYFPEWSKGQVDALPRDAQLPYCRAIQQAEGGIKKCLECDGCAAVEAQDKKKPILYTCFAGVTGVAIPVFFQDHCLGCIFAGDFLLDNPTKAKFARIKRNMRDLDLDLVQLESAYFKSPVASKHSIKTAAKLLSVMVSYIVDREQVIDLQERIYTLQKEIGDAMSTQIGLERNLDEKLAEVERLRKRLVPSLAVDENTSLIDIDGKSVKLAVKKAIDFIDKYYSEELALKDVANHVNLSPNYLSALFREQCGCTFVDYLMRKRIGKACDLLKDINMNISEVSQAVGYEDPGYFNRLFKRLIGVSPGKYRDYGAIQRDS